MRNSGGDHIIDAVLRTLLLEQMPEQVHSILTGSTETDLDRLSALADKIMDLQKPNALAAVFRDQDNSSHMSTSIAELTKKLAALTKRFNQRESRNRSRSASRNKADSESFCYFHKKFGTQARKCRKLCDWKSPTKTEN